jgi:hypothetical protein
MERLPLCDPGSRFGKAWMTNCDANSARLARWRPGSEWRRRARGNPAERIVRHAFR